MRKIAVLCIVLVFAVACRVSPVNSHPAMRVSFERSGGFAGLMMTSTADTTELPDAEAQQLQELVSRADFFNLPSKMLSNSPQPDRFQYQITVRSDGKTHTVQASESQVPEKLRPLVEMMSDRAFQR
jgi:hypothetical protein